MKKWVKYTLIGIGAWLVLAVVNKFFLEPKKQAEMAETASKDSTEKAIAHREREVKDSVHLYRLMNDKPYKDSVIKKHKQDSVDDDIRMRTHAPEMFCTISHTWNAGGFGSVAMVNITVDNKSLKDLADPVFTATFFSESGKELGTNTVEAPSLIKSSTKRVINQVNFGFLPQGTSGLTLKRTGGEWR